MATRSQIPSCSEAFVILSYIQIANHTQSHVRGIFVRAIQLNDSSYDRTVPLKNIKKNSSWYLTKIAYEGKEEWTGIQK
jgi:hypothetical protein